MRLTLFAGLFVLPVGCAVGVPPPLAARAVAQAHCDEELEAPVSLVGVDEAERQAILQASERGLVVVRYEGEGCRRRLEIMPACQHPARYAFTPRFEGASRVMRNLHELRLGLSLASEGLTVHLKGSDGLRADVISIGRLTAPERLELDRALLVGVKCASATHVVREIRLGGFALTGGPIVDLEQAANQFSRPGSSGRSVRTLMRAGDPRACVQSKRTQKRLAGCEDGVTVELAALAEGAKGRDPMVTIAGGRVGDRYVEPFVIDRTEVTVTEYQRCVADKACRPAGRGRLCTSGVPGRERHPINCVSYGQAERFCTFAKKRLPTEEEWAVAAGAGASRKFVWGDQWPPPEGVVNLADETTGQVRPSWAHVPGYVDGFAATAPVGSLPGAHSAFNVADVAGNVQEWVNAEGPKGTRIVRGASFGQSRAEHFEISRRNFYLPNRASAHVGFRCARSTGSGTGIKKTPKSPGRDASGKGAAPAK